MASVVLFSTAARAEYTPAVRVDAVEQPHASTFGGSTFVRLVNVRCPGRADGFYVIPSNGKQPQQVDILMTAMSTALRVRVSFDRTNCAAGSVSICATGSPC